ncbi:MAG: winged helix-turn-helix domain-containing protein [Lentisphaeria bacterium]|nr:winged helix-turn-helix domain-containing protein [Lentisphaeria bacterium]
MIALSAAEQVLRQSGKPLHCAEITKRVLAAGLWKTTGKTPEATIHAQLAMSIKRKGTNSPFQWTAKATFGLREWGLAEQVVSGKGIVPIPSAPHGPRAAVLSDTDEPHRHTVRQTHRRTIPPGGSAPHAPCEEEARLPLDSLGTARRRTARAPRDARACLGPACGFPCLPTVLPAL